jgi:hypothetical protein
MSGDDEERPTTQPQLPTPEAGGRRWARNSQAAAQKYAQRTAHAREAWVEHTLISLLSRLTATVDKLAREQARHSDNLDHLHRDVAALREVAHVPRPECYPDATQKRAVRRMRQTPHAPEGEVGP